MEQFLFSIFHMLSYHLHLLTLCLDWIVLHIPLLNFQEERLSSFHLQLIHGSKNMERCIECIVCHLSKKEKKTQDVTGEKER